MNSRNNIVFLFEQQGNGQSKPAQLVRAYMQCELNVISSLISLLAKQQNNS